MALRHCFRFFARQAAVPAQHADDAPACVSTGHRRRRIARLIQAWRREREDHAARMERQDALIASLKQSLVQATRNEPDHGRSRQSLQQDLATAFELLDEFEAEAVRAQGELEQVETLRSEVRAQQFLIDELEHELSRWRQPTKRAA